MANICRSGIRQYKRFFPSVVVASLLLLFGCAEIDQIKADLSDVKKDARGANIAAGEARDAANLAQSTSAATADQVSNVSEEIGKGAIDLKLDTHSFLSTGPPIFQRLIFGLFLVIATLSIMGSTLLMKVVFTLRRAQENSGEASSIQSTIRPFANIC